MSGVRKRVQVNHNTKVTAPTLLQGQRKNIPLCNFTMYNFFSLELLVGDKAEAASQSKAASCCYTVSIVSVAAVQYWTQLLGLESEANVEL